MSTPTHPPRWSRAALIALAVVVVLGLWLTWASRAATLTLGGDDTTYLTLARSLASGHYRDEFLVGAPPHAQYPPGFPLWLLLIRVIAGDGLDPAFAANALLLGLTALLTADAIRRLASPWLGVAAAAAIAFNPALGELTDQLRSEVLFLACSSVALWGSLLAAQGARRGAMLLAWAGALAAFLTRSVGILLLPALLAPLLLARAWRAAALATAIAVAVMLGWFQYTGWATSQTVGHNYALDLARVSAPDGVSAIVTRSLVNMKYYLIRLTDVPYGLPDWPGAAFDNLAGAALLLVLTAIGGWTLRRRWTAVPAYVALSLVVFLLFPWAFMRFVLAIYPALLVCTLLGARAAGSRLGTVRADRIAVAFAVVLAGCGLATQLDNARFGEACRQTTPYADARCSDDEMRSFDAAMRFVRDSLPTGAVIAASKPATVFVMSGRQAFPLDRITDTKSANILRGAPASHLLLTRLMPFERNSMAPRLEKECAALTILKEFPPATLLIAERRPGDRLPDACAAIGAFRRLGEPTYELAPATGDRLSPP